MSVDTNFLEELALGLDTVILEWYYIRIGRILESRKSDKVARKTIIRKQ